MVTAALDDFVTMRAALQVLQRHAVGDAYVVDVLVRYLPAQRLFVALRSYHDNETVPDRTINRFRYALYRLRHYELAVYALQQFNQIDMDQLRHAVDQALATRMRIC